MKRTLLAVVLALGASQYCLSQSLLLDSVSLDGVPIQTPRPSSSQEEDSTAGAVEGARGLGFQTVGPGLSASGQGGNYRIRILEIRPVTGNNPLDPVEPLLNFNGQRVNSVTELIQVIQTGSTGTGTALEYCVRSAPMHIVYAPPGPNPARTALIFGGNMNIDPQTLACTSPPPGVPSQGNFSFTMVNLPGGTMVEAYCGSNSSAKDWQFDDNGTLKNFGIVRPTNQTFSLIAVSSAGHRIEISLRVVDPGVGDPVLHIFSIRRLN